MDLMTERSPRPESRGDAAEPQHQLSFCQHHPAAGLPEKARAAGLATPPASALQRLYRRGERGASLVEYALLVGLIALVCIIAIAFFGTSVSSNFNKTGSSVSAAGS